MLIEVRLGCDASAYAVEFSIRIRCLFLLSFTPAEQG